MDSTEQDSRSGAPEIVVEPYKRIVIHELIEYHFNDMVESTLTGASVTGGGGTPILFWCNGVAFQAATLNPESEVITEELLKGVIHYASIAFAVRERFDAEIRTPRGIVRMIDQTENPNFVHLTEYLKNNSKLKR